MLETPCVILDVAQARRNIEAMQAAADAAGCALRPHIKTHKMAVFARMQVEAGAQGITCAKVSEAETMAAGGLRDIFIAYPMVGAFRIRRALALAPKLDRLILAVDSWECARELSDAAQAEGLCLEVRLEIDTGAGRTGVPLEHAAALAQRIAAMPGLTPGQDGQASRWNMRQHSCGGRSHSGCERGVFPDRCGRSPNGPGHRGSSRHVYF